MKVATTIVQWLIRIIGPILLILGVLFWTGNALTLIPIHMLLGITLVLLLWVQAGLAARAGVSWGFVALAIVWGLIVPILGMTQNQLLPGAWHWVIRVLHLLVGIIALGLAESLAARSKRIWASAPQQETAPASISSR